MCVLGLLRGDGRVGIFVGTCGRLTRRGLSGTSQEERMKFITSENGSSVGLGVMWLHLDSAAVSYMLLHTILPFPFPF